MSVSSMEEELPGRSKSAIIARHKRLTGTSVDRYRDRLKAQAGERKRHQRAIADQAVAEAMATAQRVSAGELERSEAMRRLRDEGVSLSTIGNAFGVSYQRVQQICRRRR